MPTTTIIAANDACAVAPGDTYFITIIGLRVYQASSINIVFITLSQVPSKQVSGKTSRTIPLALFSID